MASFDGKPRFMQTQTDRTLARHAKMDEAAPDIQAWRKHLPAEMIQKLQRLDEEGD